METINVKCIRTNEQKELIYKVEQIDGTKDNPIIKKRTITDNFYYKNCVHCDEKQCKVKKFYQGIY